MLNLYFMSFTVSNKDESKGGGWLIDIFRIAFFIRIIFFSDKMIFFLLELFEQKISTLPSSETHGWSNFF